MVSGILRSYKANQAYVSNIYCGWWRLLFSLTMVFGYAGALRKNMVQILQNLSPFTSATPVRFAHCSGRGFTCVFERSARQRRFAPCVHTSRPPPPTHKNTTPQHDHHHHDCARFLVSTPLDTLSCLSLHDDSHLFCCKNAAQEIGLSCMVSCVVDFVVLALLFVVSSASHPLTLATPVSFPNRYNSYW